MANENEKRETLADILAIVRRAAQYYDGEAEKSEGLLRETFKLSAANYREIANLVEAAWKREKAELVYAYNPEKVGKGRLPDGSAYALEAMREPVTGSHAVGNAAAMREALVLCSRIIGANGIRGNVFLDDIQEAHKAITDALAAPPRQCDVGTAEEQVKRYDKFCDIHDCRSDCPLFKADSCELEWAQMPYEAEEGGAQ